MKPNRIVVVGRIGSAYGIKGWTHVQSFTDPIENLLEFDQLYCRRNDEPWEQLGRVEFRRHREHLIGKIDGCEDRNDAEKLRNLELGVHQEALPSLEAGEFYWVDLIGLDVVNDDEVSLGKVTNVFETGASPVLDIHGENGNYLIPCVKPVLDSVSLGNYVKVRWDVDWQA